MRRALACAALLAAACGGEKTAPQTVLQRSFNAQDSGFVVAPLPKWGYPTQVVLTDFGSMCSLMSNIHVAPNGGLLMVTLGHLDGSGNATQAIVPGDYPQEADSRTPDALRSDTIFEWHGPACEETGQANGVSGKVTVTAASGTSISGTYDVTFDSGDHLSGSFDAAACPGINLNVSPTCP
jgi:hypothetical protein